MQDMIHLRPHHLLCLQAFRGKGYSESFVKKMTEVHAMPPVFDQNVMKELKNRGIHERVLSGIPDELCLTEDLVRGCCPDCQWQEICLAVCREKDGQRE